MKAAARGIAAIVAFASTMAVAADTWNIRAVQLDLARQKETVDFMKGYAEKISAAGYNMLVLYLEGRLKTASVPFMREDECYTPDEMREVVSHAAKFGVECVPVVSLLGHAHLFTRCAEMRRLAEGRANKWAGSTFCLSLPETRAFLERYVAEVAAVFPSKNFHVGFDEAWDIGTCELCAPIRRTRGMGPLFGEFVKWAHDVCTKNGKRMWMWDDLWEFFPEELVGCPKDVVMCNWKYDAISPWGIRARFADQMRKDWMAIYAMYGIECVASCNSIANNVRTFTDYAKRHSNCIGGLVTQWEMSAMNHGIRLPIVLGAGLYWSGKFDDAAFDFVTAGAKAAFPSLNGLELKAAAALLEEQADGHIARPNTRTDRNLRGKMRGLGPRMNDLAIATLKKSALHPGDGDIAANPLSEQALLDDMVTYAEFCRFNDLFREVVPMLRSPERTPEQVRSAKAKLAAASPELRRICERRWAQRNAWRGDLRPWEFPRADWGAKYVKELLDTPEALAAENEWWLVVDLNLPDWYGNLQLVVYGRFDGEWRRLAVGDWKPGINDENCFQSIVPFKSDTAPDALRISSEAGIGICGVNYIACVNRGKRLVPVKLLSASGFLRDAENILVDNWYPAVFGHPDRFHSAFHPEGKQKFVGTLEVALGPSPDFTPGGTKATVHDAGWRVTADGKPVHLLRMKRPWGTDGDGDGWIGFVTRKESGVTVRAESQTPLREYQILPASWYLRTVREKNADALRVKVNEPFNLTFCADGVKSPLFLTDIPEQKPLCPPDKTQTPSSRRHVGIPSICVAPKTGRLWSTWYAGPSPGEDKNNYCILATSADGGETWREVLVADPDGDGPVRAFDPNVWITPAGRLAWNWTERACSPPSATDPYTGTWADARFDRLMLADLDAEEEPGPQSAPPRIIGRGIMMDKPTFLRNGDWLLPVARWTENPSACFLRSRDGGRTFEETMDGAHFPKSQRLFDEHQTVELKDGRLLCLIRACNGPCILKSFSSDSGETWTEAVDSGLGHPSTRFFIRRLASGRILLVKHGKIGESRRSRDHLMAFLSDDEGATWKGGLMLDERRGVSYPDGCQLADGTIAITYDFDRTNARLILFATFSEADVLAGQDVSGKVRLRRVISHP